MNYLYCSTTSIDLGHWAPTYSLIWDSIAVGVFIPYSYSHEQLVLDMSECFISLDILFIPLVRIILLYEPMRRWTILCFYKFQSCEFSWPSYVPLRLLCVNSSRLTQGNLENVTISVNGILVYTTYYTRVFPLGRADWRELFHFFIEFIFRQSCSCFTKTCFICFILKKFNTMFPSIVLDW